jgi:hypothetical protein
MTSKYRKQVQPRAFNPATIKAMVEGPMPSRPDAGDAKRLAHGRSEWGFGGRKVNSLARAAQRASVSLAVGAFWEPGENSVPRPGGLFSVLCCRLREMLGHRLSALYDSLRLLFVLPERLRQILRVHLVHVC